MNIILIIILIIIVIYILKKFIQHKCSCKDVPIEERLRHINEYVQSSEYKRYCEEHKNDYPNPPEWDAYIEKER